MQHPGEEFHALDLMASPDTPLSDEITVAEKHSVLQSPDITVGGLADSGEMLDAQAKQEYRIRLHDLIEDLRKLRQRGDADRADEVQSEIDFLKTEMARAVGLGGRDRRAGSRRPNQVGCDRERISVRQRVAWETITWREIRHEAKPGISRRLLHHGNEWRRRERVAPVRDRVFSWISI